MEAILLTLLDLASSTYAITINEQVSQKKAKKMRQLCFNECGKDKFTLPFMLFLASFLNFIIVGSDVRIVTNGRHERSILHSYISLKFAIIIKTSNL